MGQTMPVMRGKLGSIEYWITTMKAQEVVSTLVVPQSIEGWEDMSIEERFQRDLNLNRIRKHIAPYLANDEDRFFGSLIVDIMNHEQMTFEPLLDVFKKDPPVAYKTAANAFGFLTMSGGEVLVPLDGQHRLKALQWAISGKDDNGKDIANVSPNLELAMEDITLILIKHNLLTSRKVFNKVNRYAKPTTKGENLITADDDVVAVLSRRLANDYFLGERLINWKSNTLTKISPYFTTLSVWYDMNFKILAETEGENIKITALPPKDKINVYEKILADVWDKILSQIHLFSNVLADKTEAGDQSRIEMREQYLLGKPAGQFVLLLTFMRMRNSLGPGDERNFPDEEICKRLNAVDWRLSNKLWQKILMNGPNIVAGKDTAALAASFISYLIGEPLSEDAKASLTERYKARFELEDQKDKSLPSPII